ncbi:helix-turn-helix domain-containing protein [Trueperella pyogenes]|uniref:helix-turn-helix domain-containing protein n=1 Tax=Trueperella pyogenes TaxID=1661 RepID=UPI003872E498
MYRRKLNQLDIARVLGIGGTTVSRKLSGKTGWSVTDLVKTAALLDISIADLIDESLVENEKRNMTPNSSESGANLSRLWESNPRPSHYE